VRLAQILNNLIANAYKYGDNFSPIRVRARAVNGYGRIEVVNAGPGIPPRNTTMCSVLSPAPRRWGGGAGPPAWDFPSPSCWSRRKAADRF